MSDTEVYLDKIKLGALIVEKELLVIEIYNRLISDIRVRPDIKKIINDYPDYHTVWRSIAELYDFLENDYSNKLGKKDKQFIKDVMAKYQSLKAVTLEELGECVRIVRKIMSISKFHDLVRKMEYERGLDKLRNRYNLKDNGKKE